MTGIPRPRPPGAGSWKRWPTSSPLVLVFEDLHWADDALLDFIDHLADWARDVPMLVVCTARPELLDRRQRLGRRQAKRAHGGALAAGRHRHRAVDRQACLEQALLPAETQAMLLGDRGGESAVRRGVRAHADRPRPPAARPRPVAAGGRRGAPGAGVGAGPDRGPAGRPARRAEAAAAGCRGAGQGGLAGRAGLDERRQPVRAGGAPARPRAAGDAAPRAAIDAWRGIRSTPSATC